MIENLTCFFTCDRNRNCRNGKHFLGEGFVRISSKSQNPRHRHRSYCSWTHQEDM